MKYIYERRDTTITGRREVGAWREENPSAELKTLLNWYRALGPQSSIILHNEGIDTHSEWRTRPADPPKVNDKVDIENIGDLPNGSIIARHGLTPWHKVSGRWINVDHPQGCTDVRVVNMNRALSLYVLRSGRA